MIKTTRDFFLDIDSYEFNKCRQYVTGDVVLTHRIKEENRVITCLSDGLGSGIKASVLANLTATMALKFISNYVDVSETAEVIMETLPVCKVRKISYSTFTIIDINGSGHASVIEHGNPDYILLRGIEVIEVPRVPLQLKKWRDREVRLSEFDFLIGDRLVYFSDGVSQAGMGLRSIRSAGARRTWSGISSSGSAGKRAYLRHVSQGRLRFAHARSTPSNQRTISPAE